MIADDDLDAQVSALASRLAGYDAKVLRETKSLFRRLQGLDREAGIREAVATAAAALVRT